MTAETRREREAMDSYLAHLETYMDDPSAVNRETLRRSMYRLILVSVRSNAPDPSAN